jgi:hypothetical protein
MSAAVNPYFGSLNGTFIDLVLVIAGNSNHPLKLSIGAGLKKVLALLYYAVRNIVTPARELIGKINDICHSLIQIRVKKL